MVAFVFRVFVALPLPSKVSVNGVACRNVSRGTWRFDASWSQCPQMCTKHSVLVALKKPTSGSSNAQLTVQSASFAPPRTEKLTPHVPSGRGVSGGMSTLHGSSPSEPILQPSR